MNRVKSYGEVLTDYDWDSFKYEYEKNNERSIVFTAYKTPNNSDIFDMLINENYIIYDGQYYVIKSTSLNYDSMIVTNEIEAKHIFMEFQNHYIDKNIEDEELNADVDEEETTPNYTLEQYLEFMFAGNVLGFEYKIVGGSNNRSPVSELGGQNGMEAIVAGAEYFNYIYFADNKTIYFYSPETFYVQSNVPIIYSGNSDEMSANVTTTELKTFIKGYGAKKTKSETKSYSPYKPKDLKYSGKFVKESIWHTTEIGASFSKTFNCKWGNETLSLTRKRGSKGGNVDIYLDNVKVDSFSQYKKTSKTDTIVVATNLEKGEHTFKMVFRGGQSGITYKQNPQMMVGTEATTVLNLTAVLKGTDVYHVIDEYKSPNYEAFGHMQAPTVFDDKATTKAMLRDSMMETFTDEPTVELSTNYLGEEDDRQYIDNEDIKENSLVRFVHKPLHFNTDLKIVKFTKFHSKLAKPVEVEFSNAKKDIIAIQNQMTMRVKRANSTIASGNWNVDENVQQDFFGDVLGSVFVND